MCMTVIINMVDFKKLRMTLTTTITMITPIGHKRSVL